jgi:hypothetical protein
LISEGFLNIWMARIILDIKTCTCDQANTLQHQWVFVCVCVCGVCVCVCV